MPRYAEIASIMIFSTSLLGCNSFTPPTQLKEITEPGTYWLSYNAERRGAIVRIGADGNAVKICSEPAPDTSSQFDLQGALKNNASIDTSVKTGQTVVILPGRTSTVLSLREALYRLCELSINRKDIPAEDILNSYNKVIAAITQHAEADAANANASNKALMSTLIPASADKSQFSEVADAERSGFESIAKGDFKTALVHFTTAATIYPGYHHVFEIKKALASIMPASGNVKDADKQTLLSNIVNKWPWGVPPDLLAQIKSQIK